MVFYTGEKSQIHESHLFKNNYNQLLAVRLTIFIYAHFIWWTQIYQRESNSYTFLPFVTNLKYLTLCGADMINLYFFLTLLDMIRFKKFNKQFQKVWKFQHFLFQLTFSSQITIFLLYWTGGYTTANEDCKNSIWYMFTTASYHGGLFVCVYIEFIINNIAFKWKHYLFILVATFLYLLDNLVVTITTKPVYKMMDWISLQSYIFVLIANILTFLHFCLGKVVYEKIKLQRIQVQTLPISCVNSNSQINSEQIEINENEQQLTEIKTQSQSQSQRNSDASSQNSEQLYPSKISQNSQ